MPKPPAAPAPPPPAPPGPVATPFAAAAEMLRNRLEKNARHRTKWARRAGVSCYRLYERDIPEIPLLVDWYEGRVHVAERARPNTDALGPGEHRAWLAAMSGAIVAALGIPQTHLFMKRRERQRGAAQYQTFDRSGERFEVTEAGRKLWVNLRDYLDTGLFLDHRPLRLRVGAEAAGKRFLNLFCYTGAFTVHAAAGGAVGSTSVDLSPTYVDWARDNFALNGMDTTAHRLVRAEVMGWLRDPVVAADRYDLMLVDPPTFSNTKRVPGNAEVFDVQRDHRALLARLGPMLNPGGTLYFSTNFQRFRLDTAAVTGAGLVATDITPETIPEDFRDAHAHRCWRLVKPA